MDKYFDYEELKNRIELNFNRLYNDTYYRIEGVFQPPEYDWPGDKEGRALLAFVSHYKISGQKIPCMKQMLEAMPEKTNRDRYFGPVADNIIFEQQLSGQSWLLRGLCEYYEQFSDTEILNLIISITEKLYLPYTGRFKNYPVNREKIDRGDVSGSNIGIVDGWNLSSDVGCAFISIDGLSHVYKLTGDIKTKKLLDEMIEVYLGIDKIELRAQTHCTLTAARGMIRMYQKTKDKKYLDGAKEIFRLYTDEGGMTFTYENANWWDRNDTWTEPCAVVDSLMVACELYKITNNEYYRKTAARIYHNGFAGIQRANGGAGTNSVVTDRNGGSDCHKALMYEAFFCCTMRLSEGLWYINENKELLYAEKEGYITKNKNGVYMDGDIIYAEISGIDERYIPKRIKVDEKYLSPLLKYYLLPKDVMEAVRQKIIFIS